MKKRTEKQTNRHEMARCPLRILAVVAHPDDMELGCSGTLARCVQRGDSVSIAIACKGESAALNVSREELVRMRGDEARTSARLLGAEVITMGFSDYGVDVNDKTRKIFTDAIRQANPDAIITHYHNDYGSDHNNTFTLVRDAALTATVPNYRTKHAAIARIPAIFMMEALGGHDFLPEVYVDISETFETKKKMLGCHRSQIDWASRHGGMDFIKYIEVVARFRGYQAGVEFAEGFIPLKSWANLAACPLLP